MKKDFHLGFSIVIIERFINIQLEMTCLESLYFEMCETSYLRFKY